MTRIAGLVVPQYPHPSPSAEIDVSELFSARQITNLHTDPVAEFSQEKGTEIWAYCWMLNHLHLS